MRKKQMTAWKLYDMHTSVRTNLAVNGLVATLAFL